MLLTHALDPIIEEIAALKVRIDALDTQLKVFANDHPVVQQEKHINIAIAALANKMARFIWAMRAKVDEYQAN